jgi:Lon protease-like protein
MNLDFSCTEKQALLEAPNLSMRWEYLLTLMEMAVAETTSGTTSNIQIN